MDIKDDDKIVSVVAIYAPNQDSPRFFTTLRDQLVLRSKFKLVIGDFNLTLDLELDRKNTYHNNNKARDKVLELMDEFLLVDVWRIQNPDMRQYSWFKGGDIQKASRIDFALASSGLDQMIEQSLYIPGVKTDHRALYLCISLNKMERGVGYWKFNTSYLKDSTFLSQMNQELAKTLTSTQSQPPQKRWETIKKRIKKVSSDYARKKVSEEKLVISQLMEKVDDYESNFPLPQHQFDLWQTTKAELEDNILNRAKGLIFRSKARWHELGEKNTKYFFSLEKSKYNAKTCYKLIDEQGQEISNTQDILDLEEKFYAKLYDADKDVTFTLHNTSAIRVPTPIQNQQEKN